MIKLNPQSCLFVDLFVNTDWVCVGLYARLLWKICLPKLIPSESCFAFLAAGIGCLNFQDVGMVLDTWQILAVTGDGGMRSDGCSLLSSKCASPEIRC